MTQKRLPIGYSTLPEIIHGNCVYIDKSKFVQQLENTGKYYFLSRPRRFGKSLLIDTLYQAFRGNKQVFTGLYLENNWDWSNKHPVIKISFSGSSATDSKQTLLAIIYSTLKHCAQTYEVDINEEQQPGLLLKNLIIELYKKYHSQVVILVDEYDKPILDVITDQPTAEMNREILKSLYSILKDLDRYLKMVFLTGVSKFSKVSLFSGLNNLDDLTLDPNYADLCGYTQTELEQNFADRLVGVDKQQLKAWYNGYNFMGDDSQKVYNPFDILLFFSKNKVYKSYWFETATPTFLIKLLLSNRYYVPNLEGITVPENVLGSLDVDSIPFGVLAFQTGYLSIKRAFTEMGRLWYELSYPNKEVKFSFTEKVASLGVGPEQSGYNMTQIYQSLKAFDFDRFKQCIQALFSSIPNDWYRNNRISEYEGFYCCIIYSYFCALNYDVIGEDVTNRGRIDLTIKTPNAIFIFEFKIADSGNEALKALEQIKDKNYAEKYRADGRPIYLMGMAFDDQSRNLVGFECEPLAP